MEENKNFREQLNTKSYEELIDICADLQTKNDRQYYLINDLKKENEDLTKEKDQLKKNFEDEYYANKNLVARISNLNEALENKSDHIIRLEGEIKDFRKVIDDKKQLIDVMSKKINYLEARNYELDGENQSLRKLSDSKEHIIEASSKKIDRLESDIEDKQNTIDMLLNNDSFKNKNLKEENESLIKTCRKYSEKCLELEKENKTLKSQLKELRNHIEYTDECCCDCEFDCDECRYELIAQHIRRKFESLCEAGFSVDQALGLIPMWSDEDYNLKE